MECTYKGFDTLTKFFYYVDLSGYWYIALVSNKFSFKQVMTFENTHNI